MWWPCPDCCQRAAWIWNLWHTHTIVQEQPNKSVRKGKHLCDKWSQQKCVFLTLWDLNQKTCILGKLGYSPSTTQLLKLDCCPYFCMFLLGEKETLQEPLDRIVGKSEVKAMWEVWSPRKMLQMWMAARTEGRGHASCTLALLSPGNTFKLPLTI